MLFFQKMSIKIYIFLFLERYKFQITYLKDKNETWNVGSYHAEQFGIIPITTQ